MAKILLNQGPLLRECTGKRFVLKTVADLDWERERGVDLSNVQTTTDFETLVSDPAIHVIVETVGDRTGFYHGPAGASRRETRGHRQQSTSCHGRKTLFKEAAEHGVELRFEASVGGGIPIIKSLREGLVANKIMNMYGLLL